MSLVGPVVLVVVIAGIVIAIFGWDRYRGDRRPARGVSAAPPTDEVFNDPQSGRRMRVWYDPTTGQREYRPEEGWEGRCPARRPRRFAGRGPPTLDPVGGRSQGAVPPAW